MSDNPGTGAEQPDPRSGVDALLGAVQSLAPLADTVDTLMDSVARLDETSEEMQGALDRRRTLDRALGILMGRGHVSAEAALEVLKSTSSRTGRDLEDIAAEIVAHAPDTESTEPEEPPSGG